MSCTVVCCSVLHVAVYCCSVPTSWKRFENASSLKLETPLLRWFSTNPVPDHALLLACLAVCTSAPAASELLRSSSSSRNGLLAGFALVFIFHQYGTPSWHIPRRPRCKYVPTALAKCETDSGSGREAGACIVLIDG